MERRLRCYHRDAEGFGNVQVLPALYVCEKDILVPITARVIIPVFQADEYPHAHESFMKPILIPPMLAELVYSACTGVEGTIFTGVPLCPACGCEGRVHDTIKRRFSRVRDESGERDVYVYVRRFQCRSCNRYLVSPAPFYEKTRFGIPVIDLCLTIARNHSCNQTAGILEQMGILVDRGTVQNLVLHTHIDVTAENFIGLQIPLSIIRLSALVTMHEPQNPLCGDDILNACDPEYTRMF